MGYVGRFAPSPTGPLHAGSLVAALGSWLDARAHGGQWLVRIEDTDTPRCPPGMAHTVLAQLAACGLHSDVPPSYQSQRSAAYQSALEALQATGHAYPCGCTRKDIEDALNALGTPKPRHGELVYPGTCRCGMGAKRARAWRFAVEPLETLFQGNLEQKPHSASVNRRFSATKIRANPFLHWHDRRLGPQQQDVAQAIGDFVLKRADGLWAYQLAVVVDDAQQGITHVVRGQDLADNTPRQILLQRALGYPTPQYLHLPLVLAADGQKLSKQNGAAAIDTNLPLAALHQAAQVLGIKISGASVTECLNAAVAKWRNLHSAQR